MCVLPVRGAGYMRGHDGHAVGGKSPRLVGADGGGVPHGLTGVQVSHQVVILHHFLRRGVNGRGVKFPMVESSRE